MRGDYKDNENSYFLRTTLRMCEIAEKKMTNSRELMVLELIDLADVAMTLF